MPNIPDSRNVRQSGLYLNLNNMENNSVYNPSMSTYRFLQEIDIRCDDHLTKFKEDFQATRYCSECKSLICDICVIDFHHEHFKSARTRIDEYFRSQKNKLENLKAKVSSSIKHKTLLNDLLVTQDSYIKNVDVFFLKRKANLESIRSKVDVLITDEIELNHKMQENIKNFYNNECYRRIDKPLKDLEECKSI